MANISITSACNRRCSYCFAADLRKSGVSYMTQEVFGQALDFLERSAIGQARLVGGEPTLHPEFTRFAEMALERGLNLLVFSNGLIPDRSLTWLEQSPSDRVGLLLNAVPSDSRQEETLARLGNRVIPGFNIHTPEFQPDFLLDLVDRFHLTRRIRFGLAHPSDTGRNDCLHPRYYTEVGERLVRFALDARARGVEMSFDCGFVPCMFPSGSLDVFGSAASQIGPRCSPVLDLLPNGDAVPCYPLAGLSRHCFTEGETAASLRAHFLPAFEFPRRTGIYRACGACESRNRGTCLGGCLAASRQRLRAPGAGQRQDTPEGESARTGRWAVPYVDQPASFWERLHAEFGEHIREVYFPLPGQLIGSGRPPQPAAYLESFLKECPLRLAVLINPVVLPKPVDDMLPALLEALRRLTGEYGVASATVANLILAERIRASMPDLSLTASALMDISAPNQALMLNGICETLVPASRVMRDLPALRLLRAAFKGRIRLIVNESCVSGCPYRAQHFYEMAFREAGSPPSLCADVLERQPWLRLTGAWVLPQHLHFLDEVCDEWKLAGRVTFRDAEMYRKVLGAYISRRALGPHEIGGGPASVLQPIEVEDRFYAHTLECSRHCHECHVCEDYYSRMMLPDLAGPLARKDSETGRLKPG